MDRLRLKTSLEFWTITAIAISGLWVRLYHLGTPSLWSDELTTVVRINHPFLETIALLRHSGFPPLHYAILNLWTSFAGNSEWALRFPSAVFSSLTIIVIYLLGCELFSTAVGLLAAALLAFSPFAVNYAQDAKMYALFWLLTATSFLFLFRFVKNNTQDSYRSYLISSVLCCYTMYTGFLFLIVQSMVFLAMGGKSIWKKWFGGQLIIIASFLPWLVLFMLSKHTNLNLRLHDVAFDYFQYFSGALLWIIGSSDDVFWEINYLLYFFPLAYLIIDLVIALYKKEPLTSYRDVLIWLIAPVLIYFIFDHFFVPAVLVYRYMGFIQVPLILLVSSQVCRFQGFVKKVFIAVMILTAMHHTYIYFRDGLRIPRQDWRSMAVELAQQKGPHDIVLVFSGLPELTYYYKGNMNGFYEFFNKRQAPSYSSEFLTQKGMLNPQVPAIFILYVKPFPEMKLNGFLLDRRVEHEGIGYLHFQRTQDEK